MARREKTKNMIKWCILSWRKVNDRASRGYFLCPWLFNRFINNLERDRVLVGSKTDTVIFQVIQDREDSEFRVLPEYRFVFF